MKKGRFLLGLFFVTLALVITLFSFSNITGFSILNNLGKSMGSMVALVFLIGGLLIGISSTQEEERKRKYDTFLSSKESVQNIAELEEKRNDPRFEIKNDADKKLRKIAHSYLAPQLQATITPEQLTPEQVRNQAAAKQQMERAIYANILSKDPSIIDSVPDKNLEQLVFEEPIQAKVQKKGKKEREIFGLYAGIIKAKDLLKRYEKDEIENPEEEKEITQYASIGAAKAQEENLRKKGFSDPDILGIGRQLAQSAVLNGYIEPRRLKALVSPGLKESIERTEKVYSEKVKTSGKKAQDITREALTDLTRGSTQEFETAATYIAGAAKGKINRYKPSRN